jgi:hypothetical protein
MAVEALNCQRIDNLDQVLPGWGYCKCRSYNGYQRALCRRCGHLQCYPFAPGELLPIYSPDGKIHEYYDPQLRTTKSAKAS